VRTDLDELVHAGQAAHRHPVAQVYMAGQRGVVGQRRAVADLAVVRDVHVGHDPVVVADARDAAVLRRAGVEGAELADRVAVADLQAGRLAGVLLVLRHRADRVELEDAVVAPDRRGPSITLWRYLVPSPIRTPRRSRHSADDRRPAPRPSTIAVGWI
jgi:hypothetical protein